MDPLSLLGQDRPYRSHKRPAQRSSADDGIRASLVIPAHEDAEALGHTLDRLANYLSRAGWRSEVIVVDDGSTDRSAEVAAIREDRFGELHVLRHGSPRGKGAAARTGVMVARGRSVMVSDVRLSCPLRNLDPMLESLEGGAELVVTSRRLSPAQTFADSSLLHKLTDSAFRRLSRFVVQLDISDVDGGFLGFQRLAAQKVARRSHIDGRAWDVEWLALAKHFGLHVMELPVGWQDYRLDASRAGGAWTRPLRELLRIRRLLDREGYDRPRSGTETLHDTCFVKMER